MATTKGKLTGFRKMRICGSFITACLRYSKTPKDDCVKGGIGITDEQLAALLAERAYIDGDNIDGYTFVWDGPMEKMVDE